MDFAHALLVYAISLKLFASAASAFYAAQIVRFKTSTTTLWSLLFVAFTLRVIQTVWSLQFYADLEDIYRRYNFSAILINNIFETAVVLTLLLAVFLSFLQFKRREQT